MRLIDLVPKLRENGGITIDLNYAEYTGRTGYVVSLRSVNTTFNNIVRELGYQVIKARAEGLLRANATFVVGAYRFDDGKTWSADLNVVVEDLRTALDIAQWNNQEAVYDLARQICINNPEYDGTPSTGISWDEIRRRFDVAPANQHTEIAV